MSKKPRTTPSGPNPFLIKTAAMLFPDESERERFMNALLGGECREQSIIVLKDSSILRVFPRLGRLPWQPEFVERLDSGFRPAKHPLYEKGNYYSLDLSSVFSASSMLAIPDKPRRVLDMCSAPGGKAIFAYRAFDPEVLVCNETIRARCGMLIDNLERCHIERSRVWCSDPSVYARRWPQAFDLVIVDAPCSGQSMIAKGEPVPGAFTPQMIDMNVGRQRRITGNAIRCLRPGGHLMYSTCTFAPKENEKIIHWLLEQYPELEVVEVPLLKEFQSRFSEKHMYRLYPHYGIGAGAFVCLLRKNGEPTEHWTPIDDLTGLWWYGKPPRESFEVTEEEPVPEEPKKLRGTPNPKAPPEPKEKPKTTKPHSRKWTPGPNRPMGFKRKAADGGFKQAGRKRGDRRK